jgi:hypothetical protein
MEDSMLAEKLDKAWGARRRSISVDPVMRFASDGLVLGAGTVLATSDPSTRQVSIDLSEPRLHVLLTAAHLRVPTDLELAHLGKAAKCWNEGQEAFAAMHLALSRLDRLERAEADAHRVFLADGLLKHGIGADAIVAALRAAPSFLENLGKYDPDQPRVPAGSGRQSGQWTSGSAASAETAQPTHDSQFEPGLRQESEVNPRTILPTAVFSQACLLAQADCKTVAIDIAVENGEGDLPVRDLKDVKTCGAAGLSCQELSFAIAYVPFLDCGGVIFPHRGVIIMRKGRPDEYRPPLPGGRTPPFWRPPSL